MHCIILGHTFLQLLLVQQKMKSFNLQFLVFSDKVSFAIAAGY